jgi:hypothetical protein
LEIEKMKAAASLFVAAMLVGSGIATPLSFKKDLMKTNFPKAKEVDRYLTTLAKFLHEVPLDNRFGRDRIPKIHEVVHIPGLDVYNELNKTFFVQSMVVGKWPADMAKNVDPKVKIGVNFPKYRIKLVHGVPVGAKDDRKKFDPVLKEIAKLTTSATDDMRKTNVESYSNSYKVGANTVWLRSKAVFSQDNACIKCHAGVKPGEPIGHVFAAIWKKK